MNLDESLNAYLKYIKFEKNLSINSFNAYKRDLYQFLNFLKKKSETNNETKNSTEDKSLQNLDVKNSINLNNFRDFLKYISKFKYSNKTLIRKFSSLNNYFKFLENNNLLDVNLSQLIVPPKSKKGLFTFLSINEMDKLVNIINTENPSGVRDRTIIEMLYSTGARVSELESIKISDLNFDKQEVRIFGKGRKNRVVFLNSRTVFWLDQYLKVREKLIIKKSKKEKIINKKNSLNNGIKNFSKNEINFFNNNEKSINNKSFINNKNNIDNENLFINKFGSKLSQRSLRNIVKKYIKAAGIGKNISPHKIRHTFATHLLQQGAGIREIQMLLGHENISTTQIYTHLNLKKLKLDFEKFHPRAK